MCGIAGFSIAPGHNPDARKIARNLLLEIVARGEHATGMAWSDADDNVWYHKAPESAHRYVKSSLDLLPRNARTVILHTRYATKGSPLVWENNHPIVRPGIVGVHNGVIPNDDEVFDLLNVERYGEVDSEAAFALLNEGEMHPTEALTLLDGRVALSWLEVDTPHTLHLARWQESPLAVGQTRLGSFVFASTIGMLRRAGADSGLAFQMAMELPEGWYLRVRAGRINDTLPIGVQTDEIRWTLQDEPKAPPARKYTPPGARWNRHGTKLTLPYGSLRQGSPSAKSGKTSKTSKAGKPASSGSQPPARKPLPNSAAKSLLSMKSDLA
jgi:predicted glutamine amidotransferase